MQGALVNFPVSMSWNPSDLLPGLYLLLLGGLLAAALRRWYDPVPRHAWVVFAAVLALLFGRVLFGGGILLPLDNLRNCPPFAHLPEPQPRSIPIHGDLVHQITPWQLEVRRAVFDGRWPLWGAHAGAGMPLLGDPQSQALQPLVLVAWPLDLWSAVGVTASLRVLIALVFLFLLLRRQGLGEPAALGGSLVFALGGFLMLWLGWPMASSAAWLPAVLYAVVRCDEEGRRRDHLLLSLTTFSLLLGGHPETIVYSLGLAGLFLLARFRARWRAGREGRPAARAFLLRSGLALALGGTLAAPVLLPVQDYIPKTHRAAVVAYNFLPRPLSELWGDLKDPEVLEAWRQRSVERLLPIAAPRAFGEFQLYWGGANLIEDASGFAGTGALLLAVLALSGAAARNRFPQERLMAGVLLVSLALIAQPPGLARLIGQIPVVGSTAIHLHHRMLMLVTFCVAWLAACEIERRMRGEGRRWTVPVAAALLAGLLVWGYAAHPHPQRPELLAGLRQQWLYGQLAVLGLTAALLLIPWRRWHRWRHGQGWALSSVLAVELLVAHLPAHPPAPRRLAYPVTPPVRFLLDHLGDDRMVGIGNTFLPNFPVAYGLSDARIDNPSLPVGYAHVLQALQRNRSMLSVSARPLHPLYDLLGVRYLITRVGVQVPLRLAFRHPAAWIYERPRPLPRLFLPEAVQIYRGEDLGAWLASNPDFAALAVVPESPERHRDWRSRDPGASALVFDLLEPEHIGARALFAERRMLASSVYQDGHWRLLVDGEPAPIAYANGLFVGTWLPPGDWDLDLLYRPGVFVAGCLLAALALAAAAAWWVPPPSRRTGGVLS
ncbi:MAG TPA: hypothetical protein VMW27_02215 [Thermoanaerobaculia bacterium]|nr:hypothetical protein [Thermoanaerobaculia bacterium]